MLQNLPVKNFYNITLNVCALNDTAKRFYERNRMKYSEVRNGENHQARSGMNL